MRHFEGSERCDIILWLFAGITDFEPEEQALVLERMSAHLADSGTLVLDLPRLSTNATRVSGQTYIIEQPRVPTYYGTLPIDAEMLRHPAHVGMDWVRRVRYLPQADRPERAGVVLLVAHRARANHTPSRCQVCRLRRCGTSLSHGK